MNDDKWTNNEWTNDNEQTINERTMNERMMNEWWTKDEQTMNERRVTTAANCTKIKNHPNLMFIVVYQSIVLRPRLSSLFVFLIIVCLCCPFSSSLFVLVVVRHPPRLRRQGWRAIHLNIMLIVVFTLIVLRPFWLFSPLLSTPLLFALLLYTHLLSCSSPLQCLWTHNHLFTLHTCDLHRNIVQLIHHTIDPSYHQAFLPLSHCAIQSCS